MPFLASASACWLQLISAVKLQSLQRGTSKVVKRDAPVEIADYDENWPKKFQAERAFLSKLLAPWLVGEIEHIGSTAVPGLAAKPVIDLMAPVASL